MSRQLAISDELPTADDDTAPDYLATIQVFDSKQQEIVSVVVGHGYRYGDTDQLRIFLVNDPRQRQLLYESTSLDITPYRQNHHQSRSVRASRQRRKSPRP